MRQRIDRLWKAVEWDDRYTNYFENNQKMAHINHRYCMENQGSYVGYGEDWVSSLFMGLNQAPVTVMIENYRTRLLWNLFMSHPDVLAGLQKLGFTHK